MSHHFLSAIPPTVSTTQTIPVHKLNEQELEILEKLVVVLTASYPDKDIGSVVRQLLIESNIFEFCSQTM